MDKVDLQITPETKINSFLKAFPEQEELLISLSPAFGKLKNPVLRKTIGRVATLAQAAKIGGIPVSELVNRLRKAAGQGEISLTEAAETGGEEPSWIQNGKKAGTLDAREMIEQGQHPIDTVLASLDKLNTDEFFELITGFLPAPLIELAAKKGYEAWSRENDGVVTTYFKRKESNA